MMSNPEPLFPDSELEHDYYFTRTPLFSFIMYLTPQLTTSGQRGEDVVDLISIVSMIIDYVILHHCMAREPVL